MSAGFDALLAEVAAAKAARDEAEARYRGLSDSLMDAQCWERYDKVSLLGSTINHHCTLQKGHDGDHGKVQP